MNNEVWSLLIMGGTKLISEFIRYRPLTSDNPQPESTVRITAEGSPETTNVTQLNTVSNTETLAYQLDLILDDISHLETEHLPAQGKILGKPCDCIAKAGRSLHRHAIETVSIAARQKKYPAVFSKLADIGSSCMAIGTLDAVASKQYDNEYLTLAGDISILRKQVDALHSVVQKAINETDVAPSGKAGKREPKAEVVATISTIANVQ
jgi:hypothetical protein